jgi:F0F1-type ATP synthase membrane subunit b/b'
MISSFIVKLKLNVMSNKNVEVKKKVKEDLSSLKDQIAKMQADHKAQVDALKVKSEELRAQAKELKAKEKAAKAELKKEEALSRAKVLKETMAKGQTSKRNLTQEVRELMMDGKTVDEMVEILKVGRKDILDRRWLIEKKAGLR